MLYGSYLFAFFSYNKYLPREHKIDEPCNLKFGVLPVLIEDLQLSLKKENILHFLFWSFGSTLDPWARLLGL